MDFHSTTVIVVRKDGKTVMAGDGQVTTGETIMKSTAKKVRRLGDGKIIAGGEVIQPDEPIMAIGSGGNYALSAARALYRNTQMNAHEIAVKSMEIASEICIYTNSNITVEEL